MHDRDKSLEEAALALQKDWSYLDSLNIPMDKLLDRSAVFVRDLEDSGQQMTAYVKVYASKKHPLQRIFRPARSQAETRNLLFFRSLGISTPRVIAWGEQRNLIGRVVSDFIITQAEADTEQLDQFVAKHCPDQNQPDQKAMRLQIARQLGKWTAKIHSEGFIHEDLKWRNILARMNMGEPELFWIDCPKGRFFGASPALERKKLKDCAALDKIAHLQCTKKERTIFLQAYLGESATEQQINEMCQKVENYRRLRFDPKDQQQRADAKEDR